MLSVALALTIVAALMLMSLIQTKRHARKAARAQARLARPVSVRTYSTAVAPLIVDAVPAEANPAPVLGRQELLARAERCQRMASRFTSPRIVQALEKLSGEFRAEAGEMERR